MAARASVALDRLTLDKGSMFPETQTPPMSVQLADAAGRVDGGIRRLGSLQTRAVTGESGRSGCG